MTSGLETQRAYSSFGAS